ncbi:LysR family transcriptional regulator [Pseudorhodoferax sp.]|uniref:LysR family transcriptional regulator n=1 Tax=Pseudorhodoferax sp. TaxID=1993553 RepID=UPI002DD67A10|nr:LysR family transcriptional regulator [Pseudorhodoferax sp.]
MNFRTLDLNLLRLFDRLMAEGSLTRAAADLAMTQPAASHALKRLHAAVGEALFVRTAVGMKPTARAEALWPQVRDALALLRNALAPEPFDPRDGKAVFRLTMADATAALLMPPLLAVLQREAARVSVRILPLISRDPRQLLLQAEADLAVGHFPAAVAALVAEGGGSALRHQHLYDSRYVCVMRRGHPLAGRVLTLDDYCAADHLLVSFSGQPVGPVDQALAAIGRRRRVVLTVNQFFTAGRVATQTDLLTVLPERFVEATGHADRLLVHELPFDTGRVSVQMLWALRMDADAGQRWLRERLQRVAG